MEIIEKYFSRYGLPLCTALVFLFLYVPIVVLIIFSLNASPNPFSWQGFTFDWYRELFLTPDIINALKTSLTVACSAVVLSMTLGVLMIFYSVDTFLKKCIPIFYVNLIAPEIVLAVGLLSLFELLSVKLGLVTLIAGHTLIGLGYVVPILQTRFNELSTKYTEASLDLGATRAQTLKRVILPLLWPAIIASGLLVFIISLDDFVVSFFCAGGASQTLPMYIFSIIRSGATPVVNALSVLLLVTSSLLVMIFSLLRVKKTDILK